MKVSHEEKTQRLLAIYKLDAKNLMKRMVERREEYIDEFSLKRDRSIFKEIFYSRYWESSAHDLSYCPEEVIISMDAFYESCDDLYWYLKHTQDMPNTIDEEVTRRLNLIKRNYQTLDLYINAMASGQSLDDDLSIATDLEGDQLYDNIER